MTDTLTVVLAFPAGAALGAVFFGGLWWTVRRAVTAGQPALWFIGSLAVRMAIAVSGLVVVSGGDWRRLVACLVGFVVARGAVTRGVATRIARPAAGQAGHAP